jgi:hypothetical protein
VVEADAMLLLISYVLNRIILKLHKRRLSIPKEASNGIFFGRVFWQTSAYRGGNPFLMSAKSAWASSRLWTGSPPKIRLHQGGTNLRNVRALQAARRGFPPLCWFFCDRGRLGARRSTRHLNCVAPPFAACERMPTDNSRRSDSPSPTQSAYSCAE